MRISSGYGPRPMGAGGIETFSWYFFRISGVALIFLALIHLFLNHVSTDVSCTSYQLVGARYSNPFWRLYDWLLLTLALLHGMNGLRIVIDHPICHTTAAARRVESSAHRRGDFARHPISTASEQRRAFRATESTRSCPRSRPLHRLRATTKSSLTSARTPPGSNENGRSPTRAKAGNRGTGPRAFSARSGWRIDACTGRRPPCSPSRSASR